MTLYLLYGLYVTSLTRHICPHSMKGYIHSSIGIYYLHLPLGFVCSCLIRDCKIKSHQAIYLVQIQLSWPVSPKIVQPTLRLNHDPLIKWSWSTNPTLLHIWRLGLLIRESLDSLHREDLNFT